MNLIFHLLNASCLKLICVYATAHGKWASISGSLRIIRFTGLLVPVCQREKNLHDNNIQYCDACGILQQKVKLSSDI